MNDYAKEFLRDYERGIAIDDQERPSESTVRQKRSHLNQISKYLDEHNINLFEMTEYEVKDFVYTMTDADYAPNTIRGRFFVLRHLLQYHRGEDNPAAGISNKWLKKEVPRHTGELVEIASGMDVEHVEDAKAAAMEAMEAHSAIRDFEPPEGWVVDEMKMVEYGKLDAVLHHDSGMELVVVPSLTSDVDDPWNLEHAILAIEEGQLFQHPNSAGQSVESVLETIYEICSFNL